MKICDLTFSSVFLDITFNLIAIVTINFLLTILVIFPLFLILSLSLFLFLSPVIRLITYHYVITIRT